MRIFFLVFLFIFRFVSIASTNEALDVFEVREDVIGLRLVHYGKELFDKLSSEVEIKLPKALISHKGSNKLKKIKYAHLLRKQQDLQDSLESGKMLRGELRKAEKQILSLEKQRVKNKIFLDDYFSGMWESLSCVGCRDYREVRQRIKALTFQIRTSERELKTLEAKKEAAEELLRSYITHVTILEHAGKKEGFFRNMSSERAQMVENILEEMIPES